MLRAPGSGALVLLPYDDVVSEVEREPEEAAVPGAVGDGGADTYAVIDHPEAVVIPLERLPGEHAEEIADDACGLLIGKLHRSVCLGLPRGSRALLRPGR